MDCYLRGWPVTTGLGVASHVNTRAIGFGKNDRWGVHTGDEVTPDSDKDEQRAQS